MISRVSKIKGVKIVKLKLLSSIQQAITPFPKFENSSTFIKKIPGVNFDVTRLYGISELVKLGVKIKKLNSLIFVSKNVLISLMNFFPNKIFY